MAIPTRGLRGIRTVTGKVESVTPDSKVCMQVTCLEMERMRHERERQNACRRIADLEARLREIEIEKAALLQSIEEPTYGPVAAGDQPQPTRPDRWRFKFRS